ncbi:MAG: hypothetical protein IJK89_02195 [Clostridia bacterium]|nr:hypothetical protein [Clostridia bacterium]
MADSKESRTVGARIVISVVLALLLLFFGTAVTARGFCLLARPVSPEQVFWTDVKEGDVVKTDSLRIIDPFLSYDGSLGKTVCCLVSFADAGGEMCVGALTLTEADPLYDVLQEYVNDPQAALGAFIVKGYFAASFTDNAGARFTGAFAKANETYADVLTELSGRYYNGSVRQTTLCFTYVCGPEENYLAAQGRIDTVSGIVGVVIACAGAAGVAFCAAVLIAERKRAKQV